MCKFCNNNAGYDMITHNATNGKDWHYYEERCKSCDRLFLSEIMEECNSVIKDTADFRKKGWISEYLLVYPEEYVRFAIHE